MFQLPLIAVSEGVCKKFPALRCSFSNGLLVPIPTFPAVSIINLDSLASVTLNKVSIIIDPKPHVPREIRLALIWIALKISTLENKRSFFVSIFLMNWTIFYLKQILL